MPAAAAAAAGSGPRAERGQDEVPEVPDGAADGHRRHAVQPWQPSAAQEEAVVRAGPGGGGRRGATGRGPGAGPWALATPSVTRERAAGRGGDRGRGRRRAGRFWLRTSRRARRAFPAAPRIHRPPIRVGTSAAGGVILAGSVTGLYL